MTNLSELQMTIAAEAAALASERYIAPVKLFATNFSPEYSTEYTGVAVPVVSFGETSAFNKESNNWCSGQELSAEIVSLDTHYKVGLTMDDVTAGNVGENGDKYVLKAGAEGAARALAKAVADKVFGALSAATGTAANVELSAIRSEIAKLHASCATAGVDPSTAIIALNPTYFGALLDTLNYANLGDQSAIKYGVIDELLGFRGVVEATSALPLSAVGFVIPYDSIAVVNRYNRPAVDSPSQIAFPAIETKTGFTIGYRLFENLCAGTLQFGADVLFGVRALQPNKIIPIKAA